MRWMVVGLVMPSLSRPRAETAVEARPLWFWGLVMTWREGEGGIKVSM